MIPTLQCQYSTVSCKDLMAKVIPDYCIDRPLNCMFWVRGANDTYQVCCADAQYSLRVYRSGAFTCEAMKFEVEALCYLYLHEGKVTHFDFEECAFGYRVYDLATFKWNCCMGERGLKRWSAFLDGYQSIRPIGESDLSLIDTFVIVRDLSNVAFEMRNVKDFGHQLTSDREIDQLCKKLKNIVEIIDQ